MVRYALNEVYNEGEDEEVREIMGCICERRDPYGFWRVAKPAKIGNKLGEFTSVSKLEQALEAYFRQNPKIEKLPAKAD